MDAAALLANPPVTLRRVMDYLEDDQDLDLSCDLDSEFGLVDLMLQGQEPKYLRELCEYLGPLLHAPNVSEAELADVIIRCRGYVFAATARESLQKLHDRARDHIAASYR
jgi:hypothetical protein